MRPARRRLNRALTGSRVPTEGQCVTVGRAPWTSINLLCYRCTQALARQFPSPAACRHAPAAATRQIRSEHQQFGDSCYLVIVSRKGPLLSGICISLSGAENRFVVSKTKHPDLHPTRLRSHHAVLVQLVASSPYNPQLASLQHKPWIIEPLGKQRKSSCLVPAIPFPFHRGKRAIHVHCGVSATLPAL